MAAGVFGIARTTAPPGRKCFSNDAMRPAGGDGEQQRIGPASFASGGSTSSMSCGFTATRITPGGCGQLVDEG